MYIKIQGLKLELFHYKGLSRIENFDGLAGMLVELLSPVTPTPFCLNWTERAAQRVMDA